MRRVRGMACALALCWMLTICGICRAQSASGIQGKVVDATGAVVPHASVLLRDLSTNKVMRATTGSDGKFDFDDVLPEPQLLTVEASGFESFTQRVTPSATHATTVRAMLNVASLQESVVVRGTVDPEAKPVPSREDVMLTPETLRVLDRKQLDAGGPLAGGAQMIQSTPGANVVGYGETGSTKYSVLLNGIQQGWAGEATSFTAPGSLGITFDGVPVSDPATGLWQSATMPQNLVMQNLAVTYGPGQPMDRWYNNIGGSVEFTPVQPTVSRHASLELTEGPYGQQNFAFVANTGNLNGWETVLGGGLGRGDSYLQGPDGFGNHAKNGSVFGKTLKSFSAGSIVLGVFYAKSGGFRPTVIPTTDVGLVEPNGTDFSQQTSGFYNVLPYSAYNKDDTNEMFLAYGRENLFLSSKSTLQNVTWFNHIRRFHHRTQDALSTGPQVDEWNNPHSNIFGDQVNMSVALPLNTVNFGGYLLHEIYDSHNIFFNPADGGDGAKQIVGVGSKFRSGYFQQDNVTFYAQDDFHPIPRVHIVPGVRVDGFGTDYSNQAYRNFSLSAGVIPSTHCSLYSDVNGAASDPFFDIFSPDRLNADGTPNLKPTTNAKDQGSICGEHASKGSVEPSIDASYTPMDWLTVYGGYDTSYRSPALGGGGGMFQSVDPAYYILAKGAYSQVGAKVHFKHAPGLGNFITGVDFFHLNYTNQELDYETATGVTGTAGGNSTYHGVDWFFDADPSSNMHFFLNFAGETANFTTYVLGNTIAACGTPSNPASGCTFYNNLPVSYVPNVTLNTGFYYGIQRNGHEMLEPRFWVESIGSQHLWSNNTGEPTAQTMGSYTTANLSLTAPISFEKQSFNLKLDMLNLANSKYNQWGYISSGGYFGALAPDQNNVPSGYINAYPGAPRAVYGTLTYQF
ncbi:MAG TPA: TonB-dependent receptor [Terracidiphilus sp.]|nr:TonB-dependent receptor [Terracidiphilus sp.]